MPKVSPTPNPPIPQAGNTLDAAAAAWREYQQTGLHLSGEEADRWLASLESGEEASAPECHG